MNAADAPTPLPFTVAKPVVGMVHLRPLPGSPRFGESMSAVLERALADSRVLVGAGVDGIMVENFGDSPFFPEAVPPETIAAMTLAVRTVQHAAEGLPVGVNVLRNDARAALGIAAATGADFIRVNVHVGTMWADQGQLTGRAHETLRARRLLGVPCPILADVHVKHATQPVGESLEDAARDARHRGGASGLIVSGSGTGAPTDPGRVARVAEAVADAPVWVGSGVTPETLPELWPVSDGFIVGSYMQEGGKAGAPVDASRASELVSAAERLRDGA